MSTNHKLWDLETTQTSGASAWIPNPAARGRWASGGGLQFSLSQFEKKKKRKKIIIIKKRTNTSVKDTVMMPGPHGGKGGGKSLSLTAVCPTTSHTLLHHWGQRSAEDVRCKHQVRPRAAAMLVSTGAGLAEHCTAPTNQAAVQSIGEEEPSKLLFFSLWIILAVLMFDFLLQKWENRKMEKKTKNEETGRARGRQSGAFSAQFKTDEKST